MRSAQTSNERHRDSFRMFLIDDNTGASAREMIAQAPDDHACSRGLAARILDQSGKHFGGSFVLDGNLRGGEKVS